MRHNRVTGKAAETALGKSANKASPLNTRISLRANDQHGQVGPWDDMPHSRRGRLAFRAHRRRDRKGRKS